MSVQPQTYSRSATITTDNAGGAIIAWGTWTGFETTIALQRISSSGNKLWMSNGVPIGGGGKQFPSIIYSVRVGVCYPVLGENSRNSATK
ncbi:MAG: hypothetical protein U5K54_09500 [Cytophagales bacterium]|nr:hypothetical protein [Cytophagales bacterium]